MMEKDFTVPQKIVEINPQHPLIKNVAALIGQDPDAGLNEQFLVLDHDRLGQRAEDALGGGGDRGRGDALQQDGELVATKAGDQVGGRTLSRSRSATATSSSSPNWWPRVSLTALNSSRSIRARLSRPGPDRVMAW